MTMKKIEQAHGQPFNLSPFSLVGCICLHFMFVSVVIFCLIRMRRCVSVDQ